MGEPAVSPRSLTWLADRHQAVLVTLRADGSPQTSNVVFALRPDTGHLWVSVTADRAKTHNLRRDPRCVLHVLGDSFWDYLSVRCEAMLGEVTTEPGDAAGRALLDYYLATAGRPPDDVEEFAAAMVAERRLVLDLAPMSTVGNGAAAST